MRSFTALSILILLGCAVSSSMAATCTFNTNNDISTADITNAIQQFATNNFSPPQDDPLGLKAREIITQPFSGTTFCVVNFFLVESTHINLSDIVFGANDIVSQCCPGDSCQGGEFTITGDTGLTVKLFIQPQGTNCPSP